MAAAQSEVTADVASNGRHVRDLMGKAAASGARLVHFTEGALSGYAKSQISSWRNVDWAIVAEELATTAGAAAELGIWVVIGCNHRLADPALPQNCLHVISDRGTIAARYSKRFCSHAEVTSWYTPGVHPVTFDVDGIRFGCALCIEVCFPPLFAEYERMRVDCVLLSTYSRDPVHGLMSRAHAATNCYWVSVAAPAQCSDDLPSMIVGPDGAAIAEAGPGTTGLVLGTIDPSAPRFDIAIRHARPWRAHALTGEPYRHRQG